MCRGLIVMGKKTKIYNIDRKRTGLYVDRHHYRRKFSDEIFSDVFDLQHENS